MGNVGFTIWVFLWAMTNRGRAMFFRNSETYRADFGINPGYHLFYFCLSYLLINYITTGARSKYFADC